ncbi:hypothetical protein ES703_33850 [subsurface metagenome]
MEQLNIEGKRSGAGFVAHKAMLINALSKALADRVILVDITLGRKGFLGYLKALGGSNIVKVIPSNGSASGSQATSKRLKVLCGSNTSYLADSEWIGDKTPMTFVQWSSLQCYVRLQSCDYLSNDRDKLLLLASQFPPLE